MGNKMTPCRLEKKKKGKKSVSSNPAMSDIRYELREDEWQ
jgi:hypothetical protein